MVTELIGEQLRQYERWQHGTWQQSIKWNMARWYIWQHSRFLGPLSRRLSHLLLTTDHFGTDATLTYPGLLVVIHLIPQLTRVSQNQIFFLADLRFVSDLFQECTWSGTDSRISTLNDVAERQLHTR